VVRRSGRHDLDVPSHAETPVVSAHLTVLRAGPHEVRTAVLLPRDHVPGSARLPVLLSPYGGPHHSEVVHGRGHAEHQWFADQGFVWWSPTVVGLRVAVRRGSAPWRATSQARWPPTSWPRSTPSPPPCPTPTSPGRRPRLVLRRLPAALLVLRHPDRVHAAVAGAPVTDWRRYDTAYTERYLGHPDDQPDRYDEQSLLALAPGLRRPLLLVHGLTDDNVVVAHTLALSAALTVAGRRTRCCRCPASPT